jgi:hypothetical protein
LQGPGRLQIAASETEAEMSDPIREMKIAKGLPLAKQLKKSEKSDKTVLADMGLLALLPDIAPEVDRPKSAPVKPPRVNAATREAARQRLLTLHERLRQERPPHKRTRAHILRLMEPGRTYVVNDIIRALAGVMGGDAVKGYMRCRMLQQGLIERVAAPPGMPHRGPLDHGSLHKDPIRWLYRLTAAGEEERRAVLEADAAA